MNDWKYRCWGLSLVLVFALAGGARAQGTAVLKLGGGDPIVANGMEILGIAWGGPTMIMGPTKISAMPPADARTVRVMKEMDKSTPVIANAIARATRFPEAILLLPEGEGSQKYFEVKLTDVMISSYQTGGTSARPTDSFSLNFAAIKFEYAPPKDASGGPAQASYDLKKSPKVAPGAALPGATDWLVAIASDAQFSKVVVRGWDPRKKTSVRTLEMEVPSGPLQEALREAHQTGVPLDLSVKAQEGGAYFQWELKKVYVTSYSISGGGMEGRPGTAHVAISLGDGQHVE